MKDAYIKFVEAQLKGRVENAWGHTIPANYGWAIPQFDFDHIDDPADASMWTKQLWDDYWHLGLDMLRNSAFHLPFPECVYIFRFHEAGAERINILHLKEEGGLLSGEVYFYQPSVNRVWVRDTIRFEVRNGLSDRIDLYMIDGSRLPFEFDDRMMNARANYTKMIVATLFMQRAKRSDATAERSPSQANMNARLAKLGQNALPAIIRVRAKTAAQLRDTPRPSIPTGSMKAPHFRRAHYRTLRSGRIIPVRPSAIHGGDEPARRYTVQAA